MADPTDSMREAATSRDAGVPPGIPVDRPTAARVYGLPLGSRHNFDVDRQFAAAGLSQFPEFIDIARHNRLFLYRAVRYLAREAGISQFLDLGSGLPSDNNVHEVAREFTPEPRVVYVDEDPIASMHGRALLADDGSTAFVEADVTRPETILEHPDTRKLIDFSAPLGVLMFSILQLLPDDEEAARTIPAFIRPAAPGSHLALSHTVTDDRAILSQMQHLSREHGLRWMMRSPQQVAGWPTDLEAVEPGLCNVDDWRPDPGQPPLPKPHPVVRQYVGAGSDRRIYAFGGVLRVR